MRKKASVVTAFGFDMGRGWPYRRPDCHVSHRPAVTVLDQPLQRDSYLLLYKGCGA
jgi:hypothetical protein